MSYFSKATIIPALWLLSFLGAFFLFPVSDGLQAAMVVTAITGLLGYQASTATIFKYSPLTILVMLLWAAVGVSVAASTAKFESLTYFFFFSAFPITFLLFSFVKTDAVLKCIRFIFLVLSVFSLIQFYFIPEMLKFGGTHWPFEDNNSLAAVLGCGALLFIGEALRGGKWAYYNVVAAVILFAAIMTTGGLAVFLGFFLVLAVLVALARPASYKPVSVFMLSVAVLLCAMVTSEMNIYHFFDTGTQSVDLFLDAGANQPNKLSGSRLFIWQAAYEIFKNHIWTGTGIGTFFLFYPEFRNINDDSAGYMAHNDFIQLAAETGIWGPLFALAIIGFLIFKTATKLKTFVTPNERMEFLIPFAVFGLIIGHSLVNFNMYVLPTLMVMGVLLAAWNNHFPLKKIHIGVQKTVRETVAFLSVMALLVPLWGCSLSEYYTTAATNALARQDIQGFAENLNLADKWSAGQNGRATLQAAKFSAATNDNNRAMMLLDRAQSKNPQLTQIYVERARILAATDINAALVEAQKALHMDEGSVLARMMVADILEQMKKPDEAYEILKAGLNGVMRAREPTAFYQRLVMASILRMDDKTTDEVQSRQKQLQH